MGTGSVDSSTQDVAVLTFEKCPICGKDIYPGNDPCLVATAAKLKSLQDTVTSALDLLDREDSRSSSTVDIAVDILEVGLRGKLSE